MIAHDIGFSGGSTVWIVATTFVTSFGASNKAIHFTAVYIVHGVFRTMRTTNVFVISVMIGFNTLTALWIWTTNRWYPVFHRYTICSWKCTKIMIKRPIFLH